MDIEFIQSGHQRAPSVVVRADGVRLSVPVFGPLQPIPHDLAHFVVERELNLQDGFWGSVAAGAIFEGMRVLDGRQPPHAHDRSRALMKANHHSILFSECLVDAALRAANGERHVRLPAVVETVAERHGVDGGMILRRLCPAVEEMCMRWRAIPEGGALHVTWREPPTRRAGSRSVKVGHMKLAEG